MTQSSLAHRPTNKKRREPQRGAKFKNTWCVNQKFESPCASASSKQCQGQQSTIIQKNRSESLNVPRPTGLLDAACAYNSTPVQGSSMNRLRTQPRHWKETEMTDTVVAVFDEYGQAQSAMNALFNAGFTHNAVKLSPADERTTTRQEALRLRPLTTDDSSGSGIGDFFRSLFGTDQDQHGDDAGLYAEVMRRGSYLLAIETDSVQESHRAADIVYQLKQLCRWRPVSRLCSGLPVWRVPRGQQAISGLSLGPVGAPYPQ